MFMTVSLSNARCIFYPEVYNELFTMIENILGVNQYPIRKEEYKAMHEANRSYFYLKYFNDFREVKKNVVCDDGQ